LAVDKQQRQLSLVQSTFAAGDHVSRHGPLPATTAQMAESGEIPAASSPRQLARFLVVVLQGLHVYDRAMADPRRTRDAVEVAMSAIRFGAVVESDT
jgi:hypothetical protein